MTNQGFMVNEQERAYLDASKPTAIAMRKREGEYKHPIPTTEEIKAAREFTIRAADCGRGGE